MRESKKNLFTSTLASKPSTTSEIKAGYLTTYHDDMIPYYYAKIMQRGLLLL